MWQQEPIKNKNLALIKFVTGLYFKKKCSITINPADRCASTNFHLKHLRISPFGIFFRVPILVRCLFEVGAVPPLNTPAFISFVWTKEMKQRKTTPAEFFCDGFLCWGQSGKMIAVMHSARLGGLHADKTSCLDSAPAVLASVHIPSIKAHLLKIPKGERKTFA